MQLKKREPSLPVELAQVKEIPPLRDEWGKDVEVVLVVYDRPTDYPEHVVVRPWAVPVVHLGNAARKPRPQPFEEAFLVGSVQEARELVRKLAPRHVRVPRVVGDDSCIVESWSSARGG
jgi:hypothetical protein